MLHIRKQLARGTHGADIAQSGNWKVISIEGLADRIHFHAGRIMGNDDAIFNVWGYFLPNFRKRGRIRYHDRHDAMNFYALWVEIAFRVDKIALFKYDVIIRNANDPQRTDGAAIIVCQFYIHKTIWCIYHLCIPLYNVLIFGIMLLCTIIIRLGVRQKEGTMSDRLQDIISALDDLDQEQLLRLRELLLALQQNPPPAEDQHQTVPPTKE